MIRHMNALSYQVLATLWLGKTGVLPPRFSANRLGNHTLPFKDCIKDMLKVDGENVGARCKQAQRTKRFIHSEPTNRTATILRTTLRQSYDPQSGGNHREPIAPGS